MRYTNIRRSKKTLRSFDKSDDKHELEYRLRLRNASFAGNEHLSDRDPVYQLGESFSRMFDLNAHRMGAQLMPESAERSTRDGQSSSTEANERYQASEASIAQKTDFSEYYKQRPDSNFYSRFAELAFNRGKLAQAVLRGSGEMMLFTCLKRSLGESLPNEQKQRRLFESSSVRKRVNSGSSVVFNRGEVNSAVGLTVNVLRDARRNVELLTKLANGDGALPDNGGAETLRKVYPFLSDRDEQAQLAEYDRLLHGADADEAGLIKSARLKTEAIIARKAQMKHQFCDTLRKMSQNASLAAAMFSSDDFITSLNSALTQNKSSVHEIEREQPSCDNVVPEVGSAPEGSDLPPTEPQNDGDANG